VTGKAYVLTRKQFTDVNPRNGAVLSNEIVTCVAVRNTTAAAVLPGTAQTVLGYQGVVDEYLPATGCPVNEVYWLVVDGPTQQPLGTRVNLVNNGTAAPRAIVPLDSKDGTEVPEDETSNPAIVVPARVGEVADAAAAPTTEAPAAEVPVAPVDTTTP
jgi:hypothetical protein